MNIQDTLVNFINKLIEDSFQGILSGELEIQQITEELKANARLSIDEFEKNFITESLVKNEILNLFPNPNISGTSTISPNEPYVPESNTTPESPRIKALTGYVMLINVDYIKSDTGYIITQIGYSHITSKIANNLAIAKKSYIQGLIQKGLPLFFVDAGKINAKILLSNTNCSDTTTSDSGQKCLSPGLFYTLYKEESNNNCQVIHTGTAKNLQIPDQYFPSCTFAILDGFINIPETSYYTFAVDSNDEVTLYLNNNCYLLSSACKIFLDKGLQKILISYKNQKKKTYKLSIAYEYQSSSYTIINDNILFHFDSSLEHNIQLTSTDTCPNGILMVTTMDATAIVNNIESDAISSIEISYKIIRK